MSERSSSVKMDRKRSSKKKRKTTFFRRKTIKLSPATRWRALIRRVINNLGWIIDRPNVLKKDEVVTQYDKFLLFQNPAERTEEDLISLAHRISSYKNLRKYNMGLRVSLLRKAHYVAYTKPVVLSRQGMYPNNVYVLVKGRATATFFMDDDDHVEVSGMREGQLVGEYGLLYDKPVAATVTTDAPTEWLVFGKHIFIHYAKEELKKRYYAVECALSKFSFFDNLKFYEMREYSVASEIITVEPNTVLSLYDGTVGLTYFILEGKCSVLQKVVLVKDLNLSYPYYKLHSDQEARDPSAETLIIKTCLLTRRAIFGLGEEACKWVFVTDSECSFMVVPRYMLFKYGKVTVWERLKHKLSNEYPSLDFILNQYIESKKWARYKHRFAKQISRNVSGNDIHKVPLLTRCLELASDDEDYILKAVDANRVFNKHSDINLKSSLQRQEQNPLLQSMSEYLPND